MKSTGTVWRCVLLVLITMVLAALWRYERDSLAGEPIASVKPGLASTSRIQSPPAAAAPMRAAEPAPGPGPAPGPAERALDLAALRESLASRADSQAEMGRIVAFARFRDRMAAYVTDKDRMSEPERVRAARELLAALPEHVERNEIVPVQAEATAAALLMDAEPDPVARTAQLQAAREQWDAYARQAVGPSPAQDARAIAYARQSRDIVQQIQSTVVDPQQQQIIIAQRLQALRVQLFDHASSSHDTH